MKKLLVNDLHFGKYKQSRQFQEYQQQTMNWIYSVYEEQEADCLIIGGDFFDNQKQLDIKIATNIVKQLFRTDIPTYFIMGNHDRYYKNTNHYNAITSIFNNFENVTIVENECLELDDMILIPWINEENIDIVTEQVYNTACKYLYGHLEISNFEMTKGIVCNKDHLPKQVLKQFEHVFSGHFHTHSTKGNITYIGAPLQLTFEDANQEKYLCLVDNNDINFINSPTDFFLKIEINDELPKIDFENKRVKIILNIARTVEIEDYLTEIKEKAESCSVVDNYTIMKNTDGDENINTENIKISSVFYEYIGNRVEESYQTEVKNIIDELMLEVNNEI